MNQEAAALSPDYYRSVSASSRTPPLHLALVACSSKKLARPKRPAKSAAWPPLARELYQGPLFRKAVAYVEHVLRPDRWAIMSAMHGYLDPETRVEPYDLRLSDISPGQLAEWGHAVGCTAWWCCNTNGHITILGGETYREPVIAWLDSIGTTTWSAPLVGMGIGEQMAWLDARVAEIVRAPAGQLDLFGKVGVVS